MTAALNGGEWSAPRPGRTLPPGKARYPLYMRLGGPHGRSGRAENLVPTGIRSRTVQPVVSRYTDWATKIRVGSEYSGQGGAWCERVSVAVLPRNRSRHETYTIHIRSYCYSLSGLFHHKSAAVLLIISNTRRVKPRYAVKTAYNGTQRNIFFFP